MNSFFYLFYLRRGFIVAYTCFIMDFLCMIYKMCMTIVLFIAFRAGKASSSCVDAFVLCKKKGYSILFITLIAFIELDLLSPNKSYNLHCENGLIVIFIL